MVLVNLIVCVIVVGVLSSSKVDIIFKKKCFML